MGRVSWLALIVYSTYSVAIEPPPATIITQKVQLTDGYFCWTLLSFDPATYSHKSQYGNFQNIKLISRREYI